MKKLVIILCVFFAGHSYGQSNNTKPKVKRVELDTLTEIKQVKALSESKNKKVVKLLKETKTLKQIPEGEKKTQPYAVKIVPADKKILKEIKIKENPKTLKVKEDQSMPNTKNDKSGVMIGSIKNCPYGKLVKINDHKPVLFGSLKRQ